MFFKKKNVIKTYDAENKKPAIRASICTGEEVAGFRDIHTGSFEEVMLIRSEKDLKEFRRAYGIEGGFHCPHSARCDILMHINLRVLWHCWNPCTGYLQNGEKHESISS